MSKMHYLPFSGKSIFIPFMVFYEVNLQQPSAWGHLFMKIYVFATCCYCFAHSGETAERYK